MKFYFASLLALFSMAANHAAAECFTGMISGAGSTTVFPVAQTWAASYLQQCPKGKVDVQYEVSGSTVGAKRVCAVSGLAPVDFGTMSRTFKSSEATVKADGYTFQCAQGDTSRTVAQLPAFNDAVVLITKDDSALFSSGQPSVTGCLKKIGCLSTDQIRWMFSNFTLAQLTTAGWNSAALKNSDGKDTTHLWSELDSSCPAVEISIAGNDIVARLSGEAEFFQKQIFPSYPAEGLRSTFVPFTNYTSAKINQYVINTKGAIAFNDYQTALTTSPTTIVLPIKSANTSNVCVQPNATTVGEGKYLPLGRLTYVNVLTSNCTSLLASADYVEYSYSADGQSDIETTFGIPLTQTQLTTGLSRLTALRATCA